MVKHVQSVCVIIDSVSTLLLDTGINTQLLDTDSTYTSEMVYRVPGAAGAGQEQQCKAAAWQAHVAGCCAFAAAASAFMAATVTCRPDHGEQAQWQ